jgi:hypothetical protein
MLKNKKYKTCAINESSKWECKINKERENGETVYSIYEVNGNIWVATFHDKKSANIFAKAYPKIKERYLAQSTIESKEISEDDVLEQELDKKIEEALQKIYN